MKIKTITLTPARARELLSGDKNNHNRVVRAARVDYYASEIASGRWRLTHHGIGIADDGTVVDGQHRMLACIQANQPIEIMLVEGVPMESQDVIDGGLLRSVGDQLHLGGMANANIVAASIKSIVTTCCGGGSVKLSVSATRDIYAIYEREIDVALTSARKCKPFLRAWIIGSLALALHADRRATEFVNQFGEGENLKKGNPAKATRDWILNRNGLAGHQSYRGGSIEALLNGVFNAIHGNEITQVKKGRQGLEYFLGRERKNVTTFREQFRQQL